MSLAAVHLATDDWQLHRFVYLWKHFGGHSGNKISYHFTFNLCNIVQIQTGVVTPGNGCDTVRQSTRSDVTSPDMHACNFTSITNDGLYLPRSMIKFSHANSSQIVWLRSEYLENVKRGDVGVCVCGPWCVCVWGVWTGIYDVTGREYRGSSSHRTRRICTDSVLPKRCTSPSAFWFVTRLQVVSCPDDSWPKFPPPGP